MGALTDADLFDHMVRIAALYIARSAAEADAFIGRERVRLGIAI